MTAADDKVAFGGTLYPGAHPALLCVDFVRAYLEPESPLYAGVEHVRAAAAKVLKAARAAGVPVLHTRVEFMPGGADGGLFYRKVPALRCLERGSPFGEFAPGLAPHSDEPVVTKQYASAFFGTSLASMLTVLNVDTLVIVGVSTSGCIRATVVDALQHGFVPVVVRDAVGDRATEPHEANLFDIRAKYGEVVSLEDALSILGRDLHHSS